MSEKHTPEALRLADRMQELADACAALSAHYEGAFNIVGGPDYQQAAALLRTQHALLMQARSTLEGWANHGHWVWPESALAQAQLNTTETLTAITQHLEPK